MPAKYKVTTEKGTYIITTEDSDTPAKPSNSAAYHPTDEQVKEPTFTRDNAGALAPVYEGLRGFSKSFGYDPANPPTTTPNFKDSLMGGLPWLAGPIGQVPGMVKGLYDQGKGIYDDAKQGNYPSAVGRTLGLGAQSLVGEKVGFEGGGESTLPTKAVGNAVKQGIKDAVTTKPSYFGAILGRRLGQGLDIPHGDTAGEFIGGLGPNLLAGLKGAYEGAKNTFKDAHKYDHITREDPFAKLRAEAASKPKATSAPKVEPPPKPKETPKNIPNTFPDWWYKYNQVKPKTTDISTSRDYLSPKEDPFAKLRVEDATKPKVEDKPVQHPVKPKEEPKNTPNTFPDWWYKSNEVEPKTTPLEKSGFDTTTKYEPFKVKSRINSLIKSRSSGDPGVPDRSARSSYKVVKPKSMGETPGESDENITPPRAEFQGNKIAETQETPQKSAATNTSEELTKDAQYNKVARYANHLEKSVGNASKALEEVRKNQASSKYWKAVHSDAGEVKTTNPPSQRTVELIIDELSKRRDRSDKAAKKVNPPSPS